METNFFLAGFCSNILIVFSHVTCAVADRQKNKQTCNDSYSGISIETQHKLVIFHQFQAMNIWFTYQQNKTDLITNCKLYDLRSIYCTRSCFCIAAKISCYVHNLKHKRFTNFGALKHSSFSVSVLALGEQGKLW